MKRLILLAALVAFPAGAHDDSSIHGHPYAMNKCDEGYQTVYTIAIIPCDHSQMWISEPITVDGQDVCEYLVKETWTDWPNCGGRELTQVEAMGWNMTTEVTE